MVEAVSKWQKQAIEAVPFPSHIRIRILGYTNQSAGKHGTRVVICLAVAVPICADVDLARITLQPLQPLGFGSFGVKERAARTGINPHTGETIEIPATKVICLKAGKALWERINH